MTDAGGQRRAGRTRTVVSLRVTAIVLATLGLLGAVVVSGPGYPASRPRLLAGSAWLSSRVVGQLTLLDGSTAEVAAQVPVAAPGDRLDVVQDGSSAYAVDQSTGTVSRVDGATFKPSAPASPIAGATDGLQAFAAPDALYALDTHRGVLVSADLHTLGPRTGPLPLAAQVDPQAVAVDGAGRLWLLDAATGDLVRFFQGRPRVRPHATAPGAGRLTVAGGVPVLVDTHSRTAQVLDPDTGDVRRTIRLDLRADDQIEVGGAPDAGRLYIAAARGVLIICALTDTSCAAAVPLTTDNSQPGVPVVAGGRVFVPDYATGRVWIVDPRTSRVLAQPQVVSPIARFQLLTRDGVVFFNDPDSQRAGVIGLGGGVRPVAKYDPRHPGTGPTGTGAPGTATPGTAPPGTPPPPPGPVPNPPVPPGGGPPSGPVPPPAGQPDLPALAIAVTTSTPEVGQPVTMSVRTSGPPAPQRVRWFFGDGQQADGPQATHSWPAAQRYLVSVQATFPDGRTATAATTIDVSGPAASPSPSPSPSPQLPATVQLTIRTSGDIGIGRVTSSVLANPCMSMCTVQVPRGQVVDLQADTQGAPIGFDGWSGACSGSATTCAVTMTAEKTVTATFFQWFRLIVEPDDTTGAVAPAGCCAIDVSGALNQRCTDVCVLQVRSGDRLQFTAAAVQPGWKANGAWGGACAGTTGSTCRVTVQGITTVQKIFTRTG